MVKLGHLKTTVTMFRCQIYGRKRSWTLLKVKTHDLNDETLSICEMKAFFVPLQHMSDGTVRFTIISSSNTRSHVSI